MHQSLNEPSTEPVQQDADLSDGKVIRLFPRQRPAPEKTPEPPQPDDDDPGPSAA
jgi:hypothetical protein